MTKPWRLALPDALSSGTAAAVLSAGALAALGSVFSTSAVGPINAVSHWFWGDRATRTDAVDARHTLLGFATHHVASVFWAVVFERFFARRAQGDTAAALASGAATAALAATVDYTITPKRFTPGYEKRLSPAALVLVYGAFGLGLALVGRLR